MARRSGKLPSLPKLLDRKLYKTGQTRGADDDEIYQNRVLRNGTVLIPYGSYATCSIPDDGTSGYENGFIVLLEPQWYFEQSDADRELKKHGLELGKNALVFYQKRRDWDTNNPISLGWKVASQRQSDLKGQYVARVSATTAEPKVNQGFNSTSSKGAGIRVYEYASTDTIQSCRLQLEALLWLARDVESSMVTLGMSAAEIVERKKVILQRADESGLLDTARLTTQRLISAEGTTICPLCREEMTALGFASKVAQAEGREVFDLTVTEVSLFHVDELRVGKLSHRPYNLGWGHHHCNVVVKDAGIDRTLEWMSSVLNRNRDA